MMPAMRRSLVPLIFLAACSDGARSGSTRDPGGGGGGGGAGDVPIGKDDGTGGGGGSVGGQVDPDAPPLEIGCGDGAPAAACEQLKTSLGARAIWSDSAATRLAPCAADAADRIGEWRYALTAPLYTTTFDLTADELGKLWKQGDLRMDEATRAALAPALGDGSPEIVPAGERVEPTSKRFAIVAAHDLYPQWKVVRIGGVHPLADDASGSPLTIPLCLAGKPAGAHVANIDPAKLTTIAMTGVTAMTRQMGKLMDEKGPTYPAKAVEFWFEGIDIVHVSNEVSFVPNCKHNDHGTSFCSKDVYMEALQAIGADVIELTGSHLADKGRKWLARTVDMYDQAGMKYFGGGRDQLEAARPLIMESNGNKIAFVGCNVPRSEEGWVDEDEPDVAYCDYKRMAWEVQDLRSRGYVPIVAIQHWEHDQADPDDKLVRDFRYMAESGAALVFGSQGHFPQGWEVHHGAYIHYGTGNFLFFQGIERNKPASHDRLYIHDGRLLSVEQLFTRLYETGRLREMTAKERDGFIEAMRKGITKIKKSDPWAPAKTGAPPRQRPDSILIDKKLQRLLVSVPPAGAEGQPLLVYLHGTIERGEPLDKLRDYGIPNVIDAAPDAFPMVAASPQIHDTNGKWSPERVIAVRDYMLAKYKVDPKRTYLTGFSYGGGGAWRTAVTYPDKFAAVVPIAGYSAPGKACAIKELPVWVFHGDKDANVPLEQSQKMMKAIEECGGKAAKLTVYEGLAHQDTWKRAYNDPALYTWLLSHAN